MSVRPSATSEVIFPYCFWLWPPLWSSSQSSWLLKGGVLCYLWGTNWIYICYVEESRPPLWCSSEFLATDPGVQVLSRCYQMFWEVVDLERSPLSLVSTTEELLGRKSSGSGLVSREYGHRDPLRWPCGTLYPQTLALTSPKSGSLGADSNHGIFLDSILLQYSFISVWTSYRIYYAGSLNTPVTGYGGCTGPPVRPWELCRGSHFPLWRRESFKSWGCGTRDVIPAKWCYKSVRGRKGDMRASKFNLITMIYAKNYQHPNLISDTVV
jgi:hypothetical protein